MLCSQFGSAVTKIFNKYKKMTPKKVFGNPEFFSQPKFPEKGRVLSKLDRPCDVTGRVILFSYFFSCKFRLK